VSDFEQSVLAVIAALGRGDVVTYGEVAAEAGHPGAGRAVGSVLRRTDADVPWWRVVGASGHLRSPDTARQARLLTDDGVLVVSGRVRLKRVPGSLAR
jgi:methylated-DNA-protein-cysteine methyltransferase-like protein